MTEGDQAADEWQMTDNYTCINLFQITNTWRKYYTIGVTVTSRLILNYSAGDFLTLSLPLFLICCLLSSLPPVVSQSLWCCNTVGLLWPHFPRCICGSGLLTELIGWEDFSIDQPSPGAMSAWYSSEVWLTDTHHWFSVFHPWCHSIFFALLCYCIHRKKCFLFFLNIHLLCLLLHMDIANNKHMSLLALSFCVHKQKRALHGSIQLSVTSFTSQGSILPDSCTVPP